jgi:predicted dehydrogenase
VAGAANQALTADSNVTLHALGDVFPDQLEKSLKTLQKVQPAKVDVPRARQHVGWDAYEKVIESCDVVLLVTPPQFRPLHLKAIVEARKHVFAEKPVACAVCWPPRPRPRPQGGRARSSSAACAGATRRACAR